MTGSNVVKLQTGGAIAPIVPTSIEEVFRLATAIAKSGLAPRDMNKPEQITIAIMHGMEIGLPPMQAVQKIAVINGRPTLWGDALPALLWARGFKLDEDVSEDGARCKITRPDGTEVVRTFTKADAEKAGLWSKSGPWKQYPSRMMQMRARGYAARDGAADVLSGLYLAEEMQDAGMKNITPASEIDVPEVPDQEQTASDGMIEVPEVPEQEHEAIVDVEAFVRMVEDDIAGASGDAEAMADVAEKYDDDLLSRLPDDARARVEKLIEDAGQ